MALGNGDVPVDSSDPLGRVLWGWIRDRFSQAARADVTPLFERWSVPLP